MHILEGAAASNIMIQLVKCSFRCRKVKTALPLSVSSIVSENILLQFQSIQDGVF